MRRCYAPSLALPEVREITEVPLDSPDHNLRKRLLFTAMLVFHIFAFLACWSYNWADWPSERLAPAVWPVENMCGPAGA